jgi:hypothetical protein
VSSGGFSAAVKPPGLAYKHSSPSGVEIKKELRCDTSPHVLHVVQKDNFISTLNISLVLKLIYSFCPNRYVGIRILFFWDVMLLFLTVSSQQCEGTFCLYRQGSRGTTLEGESIMFIETSSADLLVVTRHHIPEKRISQPHRCENRKTHSPPLQVYSYYFSGFCVLLARTAEAQQSQNDFKSLPRLLTP